MLFLSFLPSSTHWFDLKVFVWLLVEPTCNITKIFENVYLDDISSPFQMSEILLFCFCIWSPPQNTKLFCIWSATSKYQIILYLIRHIKFSWHLERVQRAPSLIVQTVFTWRFVNTHYLVVRIVRISLTKDLL